jgi:sec-independent protein translocase protein TatC
VKQFDPPESEQGPEPEVPSPPPAAGVGADEQALPVAREDPSIPVRAEGEEEVGGGAMTFLDHLEELRRRLLVAVVSVFIFAGVGYHFAPNVFGMAMGRMPQSAQHADIGAQVRTLLKRWVGGDETVPIPAESVTAAPVVLAQPLETARAVLDSVLAAAFSGDTEAQQKVADAITALIEAERTLVAATVGTESTRGKAELIVTSPAGAVITKLKIAAFVGIVLSAPVIFYQLWMFVMPGLMKNERRVVLFLVAPTTIFFAMGVYFSYLILPLITAFFSSVAADLGTEQRWIADDYLSFVLKMLLVGGCSFQLPVVSYGLASVGLIGPKTLRRHRRVAAVVILIFAAAFTPPDPLSMLFMGMPLMVLYEISILVAVFAHRKAEES